MIGISLILLSGHLVRKKNFNPYYTAAGSKYYTTRPKSFFWGGRGGGGGGPAWGPWVRKDEKY
jgi:hypothetical protein